jgi:hypothetical protein
MFGLELDANIYMAFGCQGKNLSCRSEREEEKLSVQRVNEALTNDPMVPAFVFRHESQYAKTRLHQTSIEIN